MSAKGGKPKAATARGKGAPPTHSLQSQHSIAAGPKQVVLSIVRARGLRNADFGIRAKDRSDPYVECLLKDKPATTFRTQVVKDNLDPEWNEQHTIEDYETGDELEFYVLDCDAEEEKEDDLLGYAFLPGEDFRLNGFSGSIPLKDDQASPEAPQATLDVRVHLEARTNPSTAATPTASASDDVKRASGSKSPPQHSAVVTSTQEPPKSDSHDAGVDAGGTAAANALPQPPKPPAQAEPIQGSSEGEMHKGSHSADLSQWHPKGTSKGDPVHYAHPKGAKNGDPIHAAHTKGKVGATETGLELTILRARGLRNADAKSQKGGYPGHAPDLSDPYVECQIRGKPQSRFKTRIVQDTLNPEWNERHVMAVFVPGDELEFHVLDSDPEKQRGKGAKAKPKPAPKGGAGKAGKGLHDDMLGIAVFRTRELDAHGFEGPLPLHDPKQPQAQCGVLEVRLNYLGGAQTQGKAPLAAVTPARVLKIKVLRAAGLRPSASSKMQGGEGTADSYCSVELAGKLESKRRTRTVKRTLDPMWNEEHSIFGYAGDDVHFQVVSKDARREVLGHAMLHSTDINSSGMEGFEKDLALEDCGDGFNSSLTVSVKVSYEADDEEESQADDAAQDGPALVPKRPDPVPQAPAFPIQRHNTWAQWLRHHAYDNDRSLVEEAVAKDRRAAALEQQARIRNTKGRPSTQMSGKGPDTATAQTHGTSGKGSPAATAAPVDTGPTSQDERSEPRQLEEAVLTAALGQSTSPGRLVRERRALRGSLDPDVQSLRQLQEPDTMALVPEGPEELSEPDSQGSTESISGDIVRPWDSTTSDHRYTYSRDKAVRFTTGWKPLAWSQEDWKKQLHARGAMPGLVDGRDELSEDDLQRKVAEQLAREEEAERRLQAALPGARDPAVFEVQRRIRDRLLQVPECMPPAQPSLNSAGIMEAVGLQRELRGDISAIADRGSRASYVHPAMPGYPNPGMADMSRPPPLVLNPAFAGRGTGGAVQPPRMGSW